jgi:hypothetical protein
MTTVMLCIEHWLYRLRLLYTAPNKILEKNVIQRI